MITGGVILKITQVFEALADGFDFIHREFFFISALGYEVAKYINDKFINAAEPTAFYDSLHLVIKRSGDFQCDAVAAHLPHSR
jgi:hypothetical protein